MGNHIQSAIIVLTQKLYIRNKPVFAAKVECPFQFSVMLRKYKPLTSQIIQGQTMTICKGMLIPHQHKDCSSLCKKNPRQIPLIILRNDKGIQIRHQIVFKQKSFPKDLDSHIRVILPKKRQENEQRVTFNSCSDSEGSLLRSSLSQIIL